MRTHPSCSVNSKKKNKTKKPQNTSTSNNQIDVLVLSPVSYYTVAEQDLVLTESSSCADKVLFSFAVCKHLGKIS